MFTCTWHISGCGLLGREEGRIGGGVGCISICVGRAVVGEQCVLLGKEEITQSGVFRRDSEMFLRIGECWYWSSCVAMAAGEV
jgi:hypothetical protein